MTSPRQSTLAAVLGSALNSVRKVVGVSDMSGYFPLSNKPRIDESAVTNNWAAGRAAVLLEFARLLESLDPAADPEALLAGWTVRELAADVLVGARAPRQSNPLAVAKRALRSSASRARERHAAARAYLLESESVARDIRSLAQDAATPVSVTELGDALVATLDTSRSLAMPVTVDPVASGAVALARSLSGPPEARAVASDNALVAVDADWQVGRGSRREATAQTIVLFLYGRGWTEPRGG